MTKRKVLRKKRPAPAPPKADENPTIPNEESSPVTSEAPSSERMINGKASIPPISPQEYQSPSPSIPTFSQPPQGPANIGGTAPSPEWNSIDYATGRGAVGNGIFHTGAPQETLSEKKSEEVPRNESDDWITYLWSFIYSKDA